jgi:V8-like Glu-specific endopeptidase
MKKSMMVGVAAVAALVSVVAASAITYGVPDGGGHPEVGALLAQQAYSDGTWEECTGTLIAANIFLTAAHCDEGVSRVAVTFDSSYDPARGTTYWGTWHADPNYNQSQSDPHDLAVVVLDKNVRGVTPAQLPAAGSLSDLRSDQQFTSVGYGPSASPTAQVGRRSTTQTSATSR